MTSIDVHADSNSSGVTVPLIEVRHLSKEFVPGKSVLSDINLAVQPGDRICIVGPSGSGKTTLLRCMNLLESPSSGELSYRGTLVGEWPLAGRMKINLEQHRKRFGFVFQHFELFPHLSALENITLGPRHVLGHPKETADQQARALLERVGLLEYQAARPRQLSGGQQQRVAIARALAMSPDLLLFDEPTSALDTEMVDEVLDIIADLAIDGITMVIVTHELGFARRVSNRVVVIDRGVICEEGPTQTLFERPAEARTREILGGSRHNW